MKQMQQILTQHYNSTQSYSENPSILKDIVTELNKNGILIISWMEWTPKLWSIKKIIQKTKMEDNFFYFNWFLNINNAISDQWDLETLYNKKKIIILENIDWVKDIKMFIEKYFKKWVKIIIIWNNIQLKWVVNIEILPEQEWIHHSEINTELSDLQAHKILSQDIYIKNKLKNFALLKNIIEQLAIWNTLTSVRNLHTELNKIGSKISQITLLEYIDYILQSKLIKKVLRYDYKTKKKSTGKAKYFFSSTQIRNSLSYYTLSQETLNENLVFQKLENLWWEILTWKNGAFNFSFSTDKNIVHVSHHSEKNEVKKEAKKLLKIPSKKNKYLVVESIKEIGIRPSTYLPLQIVEVEDFLKLDLTKKS